MPLPCDGRPLHFTVRQTDEVDPTGASHGSESLAAQDGDPWRWRGFWRVTGSEHAEGVVSHGEAQWTRLRAAPAWLHHGEGTRNAAVRRALQTSPRQCTQDKDRADKAGRASLGDRWLARGTAPGIQGA